MVIRKRVRVLATTVVVAAFLAVVVVLGSDRAHEAPRLQLHAGTAWLASTKVGQLTLLDGSSAEVAARVNVAAPGSPLLVSQQESTGYVINRQDGSVTRVDGATQQTIRSAIAADTIYPTSHGLFALDSNRGLLTPFDSATLAPSGAPLPLAAQVTPDAAVVDDDGRLWIFDQRTGELVWFPPDGRRSRGQAGTPGQTRLTVANGAPAVLDLTRRAAEFLDPETGEVQAATRADLRPDDMVAVSGSPHQRRLFVSVASRGLLMVCTDTCASPIPLGKGNADLGPALEAHEHAIVPDYATGRVWIVDLATMRVVVERQLFDHPVRFELLNRDGVIFFNDPATDQAGVLELDGRVRAVTKYDPAKPDKAFPAQAVDSHDKPRQQIAAPPNPGQTGQAPPVTGPGAPASPGPTPLLAPTIVVKPGNRGVVGDDFEFTVVAPSLGTARWRFGGDGVETTGVTVKHRWDQRGEFQVNVAATSATGQALPVATTTVVVEPQELSITQLIADPASPRVGEPVSFGAVTKGKVDQREWTVVQDAGGAVKARSDQPGFRHTFEAPGNYTVSLTVSAGTNRVQKSLPITVAARPPTVKCGDTITASTTLTADLSCTGALGLTLASNVVLDLGGHSLITPQPLASGSVGVDVKGSNVTIRNGNITNFRTGISTTGTTGVTVSNVVIFSTSDGGDFQPERGADIFGDRTRMNLDGVKLDGKIAFYIDHGSTMSMTGSTVMYRRDENLLVSNARCAHDSSCAIGGESTLRIRQFNCDLDLEPTFSSDLSVEDSTLYISLAGSKCRSMSFKNNKRVKHIGAAAMASMVFTGNTVESTGVTSDGNALGSDGTLLIENNTFSGATVGLTIGGGSGRIAGNHFINNQLAGLQFDSGPPLEIVGNDFTGNGWNAGFSDFWGGLIGTHKAGGDRTVTMQGNRAFDNKGWGIMVDSRFVTDLGGNTSVGDEKPCVGVQCN